MMAMIPRLIQVVACVLSVGLLSLMLVLAGQFPTLAQSFPGLGWSEGDITSQPQVPVFTRGNLEVAPVFLDGQLIGTVSSSIHLPSDKDGNQSSSYDAASRSHLIHSKLQKILDNMNYYSQEVLPSQGISQPEAQARELRQQLVTDISEKEGTVFVALTFPQDDFPEIVYSVTEAEIAKPRIVSSQPLKIAARAAQGIEDVLIQAWKERQPTHLLAQAQQALLVLVALSATSLCLIWAQKYLAVRQKELSESLSNPESGTLQEAWTSMPSKIARGLGTLSPQLQKLYLCQHYSINAFYRSGLFCLQWLIWLLGIGYLTSLFYWSRPFSNWIVGVTIRGFRPEAATVRGWPPADWLFSFGQEATLGTPLVVLLLLLATGLSLKAGNALIDFLVRGWSQEQSNQRYILRAPTLAKTIKGWLKVIVYLLLGTALAYNLHQLGTITQVVAVILGFLSFALSLASQDLLKDLLGGLLILWEDQYAVGDVIVVGDQGGLVENITLRVTQLRNLDGELITIPNRSIETVRNLSSDWSRVNYAIEVGYDADVDKVMEVMQVIAQQLYREPQWQEQILEAPEILGIDNIAHTGILIRTIIKTQPLQQWSVAREFRRRLKRAFDEQGIKVGVPQQMMYVNEPLAKPNIYRENNGKN
jgi:small conductance mechanosensitive channel